VLLFSVHDCQVPREASLTVLEKVIAEQCLLSKTYNHAIHGNVSVKLYLEFMICDMKERHALTHVVKYAGNSSVCVKCKKMKSNLHILGENCTARSNNDFHKFIDEVKSKLDDEDDGDRIRKKIASMEKKHSYRYAHLFLFTIGVDLFTRYIA
jgi:hypothetical protein